MRASSRPARVAVRGRSAVVLVLAVLLLPACQPVDTDLGREATEEAGGTTTPDPGAPTTGSRMPEDLRALLAEHGSSAAQWQEGAIPVEIVAELADGRWMAATLTYLAPEADRFLVIETGPEGTSQQRPTLETLGLQPVPEGALAEVPSLPELALPPETLVAEAEDALAACDADSPVTVVLYATGAPAAWDGERWTEPPRWTAALSTAQAGGAVVDPVTAEHTGRCLDPE